MKDKNESLEKLKHYLFELRYSLLNFYGSKDEYRFDKNDNNELKNKINENIENMFSIIQELDKFIENKKWEIEKIRKHEIFNSFLLIVPTLLTLIALVYSFCFSPSKPHEEHILNSTKNKVEFINDSIIKDNIILNKKIKALQDSLNLQKKEAKNKI